MPGGTAPFDQREETVRVAGGDDVTITVRSTRHGPLLSDASEELRGVGTTAPVDGQPAGNRDPGYGVSLRWTALELDVPQTPSSTSTRRRRGSTSARQLGCSRCRRKTSCADVEGHIGYQSPGRIPIRPSGPGRPLGRWPAAGWSNEDEWLGYIPFEELPSTYDPPEGYIVTANNAVAAPTYPNYLTDEWAYGYRSQRIVERIEELDNGIDIDAMTDIQRDTRNGNAAYLVPMLLDVQLDPWEREAQDLLRDWDYRHRRPAAAAYFNAVWKNLLSITFDDELPEANPSRRWRPLVRGRSAADGRARQRLVGQRHDERRARDARHRSAAGAGRCTRRDDAASGQGSARVDVGMGARVGGPQRHLRHVRHRPDRVALQPWAATPWRRPLHRGCRRGMPPRVTKSTGCRRCGWSSISTIWIVLAGST